VGTSITIDGATTTIYEQVDRALEIAGLPIANYDELTGGGFDTEGQVHVFNGKGEIIGTTNGRAIPQNSTLKCHIETWESIVKPALDAAALAKGLGGPLRYRKVAFTLVDQFTSQEIGAPSYTKRQSFKVKAEKPDTPKDNVFMLEIELFPTTLPEIKYS
jgi:hypothetical protein